jgi:signal peptidase II
MSKTRSDRFAVAYKVLKSNGQFLLLTLIALLICVTDVASKNWIFKLVELHTNNTNSFDDMIKLLPGLNLVTVHNKGITFGMLDDLPFGEVIITSFSVIIIVFLAFLMHKNDNPLRYRLGLCFVIGGALGNLYDRIHFGSVRDFVDFYIDIYHWPAFNLADSMICIGVFILLLDDWLNRKCVKLKKL